MDDLALYLRLCGRLLVGLQPATGAPLPGAASSPTDFFWLGTAVAGWGVLIALAAGPTVLGFGLYNTSLTYLPSSVANLIVTLEVVFTAVTAYILLGERLSLVQLAGGAMILGAVVLLRIHEGRVASQSQPELQAQPAGILPD